MNGTRSRERYDVVVAGGGAAGVGAAIGAAQTGARVALIESAPFLGGAATRSGVLTYCGFWTQSEPPAAAVGGVGAQVLAELTRIGGASGPIRTVATRVVIALIEPEPVKYALDRLCARAGVEVLLHARITEAAGAGERVTTVGARDHGGAWMLEAAAFVDASGDGDLAAYAGAATRYGDADGRVQNGTLAIRIAGIAPEAVVSRELWSQAIRAAKARGVTTLSKEHGLVARMPGNGDAIAFLADEDYDARDARSLTRAEISGRAQAWAILEALRELPGYEHAYLAQTGPAIGTRESRHAVAMVPLTDAAVLAAHIDDDAVALGAWPVEHHPAPGAPNAWKRLRGDGAYGVPLDALRSIDRTNLFAAGRVIDAQPDAFASVRVMGTAFATGHAAGIAAALTARDGRAETRSVRAELIRQDAILSLEGTPV
jgi:succinate dehydrogenase/fumarate reductase flavoprotein subunit